MLGCEPPPRLLLIDVSPLGDAHERVMRLEHVRLDEMHVVGCHQRQVGRVGHLDEAALSRRLGGCARAFGPRVALQFDIEPPWKGRGQPRYQRLGGRALACLQEPPHRAARPAGQADEPRGMGLQFFQPHLRRLSRAAQMGAGVELHQIAVTCLVLRQ